jgi:pyridinium-3,5-bisthiocarboxylic acid mononucleotide nickel chelatase
MKKTRPNPLKGLHLHFDPLSGIAGDMTVAALVDLGVPAKVVTDAVKAMKVPGLKVGFEKRKRGAFAGLGFVVDWPGSGKGHHEHSHQHHHDHDDDDHDHDHHHEHRDHAEIQRLIRRARLGSDVQELALEIFSKIARVEAKLHGVPVARVAFHEVGAYDSIADIVGAAAAIAWLEPSSISSTPVVVGTGTAWTGHGRVPVPAPATAALLQGIPVLAEGQGELTTPTGAAILATVVDEFVPLPPMVLRGTGHGAGTRELHDRANLLRVTAGQPVGEALPPSATEVRLYQANIDDMNPQLVEPLMTALFAAGALDVWVTSILMKKGRPALEVSALAEADRRAEVARTFFENSTTLGVREAPYDRVVLGRSKARVDTRFGPVTVKVAALDGQVLGATPEFDDCRRLAARAGVPVRSVLAEATAAAARLPRPGAKR